MESLLANYGSSDEEGGGGRGEDVKEQKPRSPPPSKPFSSSIPRPRSTSSSSPFSVLPPSKSSSSLFSSLLPPKSSSFSASAAATATITSSSPKTTSSSSLFGSLPAPKTTSSSSLFGSLPAPKTTSSSSISSSLPQPKSATSSSFSSSSSSSSSSFFSSLPPPKSQQPIPSLPSDPTSKRVVRFRPPINPALFKPNDDDEDDDDRDKGRRRTQDFSSKPLSSIIPPPKNTLCLAPLASSASARRSVVEADVSSSTEAISTEEAGDAGFVDHGSYGAQWATGYAETGVNGQLDSVAAGGGVASTWALSAGSHDAYGNCGSYEGYQNFGSFEGEWDYGSSAAEAAIATGIPESARTALKRGRDDIPSEVLEVRQDELMANRPREDQVKLTGIAFGPSYQPASSGKGKPSKLHRRKHQIGSLYFDMKQKEMELAERRAKGLLTKKETQAKYGW